MITNLISFLYDIKVEVVRKSNNSYIFLYNDDFYIFKKCNLREDYLMYIYNYINDSNTLYHNIVKNRHNKYVSSYNNENYILMKIKFNINRMLLLDDIYLSGAHHVSYMRKNDFNWTKLWKLKIDQVEYFINNYQQLNISSLAIINYYLGLSEVAISFFDTIKLDDYIPVSLSHNRIENNSDLYDYYSVTNVIFDHVTRDMGEYIKNYIYCNNSINMDNYQVLKRLNINDKYMLISRILFPSYFFDVFDDFVLNERDFVDFDKYFSCMDIYENNLKSVISYILK